MSVEVAFLEDTPDSVIAHVLRELTQGGTEVCVRIVHP